MSISIQEAAVYLALAASKTKGNKDVALAVSVKADNPVILGMGINDAKGANDSRSAIINLLQNSEFWRKIRGKQDYFIASSTPPDLRSQGMARMARFSKPARIFAADTKNSIGISLNTWNKKTSVWELSELGNFLEGELKLDSIKIADLKSEKRTEKAFSWLDKVKKTAHLVGSLEKKLIDSFQSVPEFKSFLGIPAFDLSPDMQARGGSRRSSPFRDNLFMHMAWAIVQAAFFNKNEDKSRKSFVGGHNIGSVLRGPNDEILGWGFNTGGLQSTFHGEVNLIQNFHKNNSQKAIPKNSILYTTLEPCHMCAAMFAQSGRELLCRFGLRDYGILNSALAGTGTNNNKQVYFSTPIGESLNKHYDPNGKFLEQRKKKLLKERPPAITTLLMENESRGIMGFAYFKYKHLKPDQGEHELRIWNAGNEIIKSINPNIVRP